jgi:hypothetical protein
MTFQDEQRRASEQWAEIRRRTWDTQTPEDPPAVRNWAYMVNCLSHLLIPLGEESRKELKEFMLEGSTASFALVSMMDYWNIITEPEEKPEHRQNSEELLSRQYQILTDSYQETNDENYVRAVMFFSQIQDGHPRYE